VLGIAFLEGATKEQQIGGLEKLYTVFINQRW